MIITFYNQCDDGYVDCDDDNDGVDHLAITRSNLLS